MKNNLGTLVKEVITASGIGIILMNSSCASTGRFVNNPITETREECRTDITYFTSHPCYSVIVEYNKEQERGSSNTDESKENRGGENYTTVRYNESDRHERDPRLCVCCDPRTAEE